MKTIVRIGALIIAAVTASAHAQIEKRDVHIAVGGKVALYALPLDGIVSLAEWRLMRWQPRSGETERT